jgi:hypothetical protein
MFIYCAFVFDLYKWCIFIAATGTQVSSQKDVLHLRQKKLKIALIIVQASIIVVSLTFCIGILATTEDKQLEPGQ